MSLGETVMCLKDQPILLVEDDDVDTECFYRALKKRGINNTLHSVKDGVAALDFLKNNLSCSYVIFLDINMPRMDGFEFLEKIRCSENISGHVVFMLTTSRRPEDILTAYDKNVAGFFSKDNVSGVVEVLEQYLSCNIFPQECASAAS